MPIANTRYLSRQSASLKTVRMCNPLPHLQPILGIDSYITASETLIGFDHLATLQSPPIEVPQRPISYEQKSQPHHSPRRSPGFFSYRFLLPLITFVFSIWLEGLTLKLPSTGAGTLGPGERVGAVHIHTRASDGSGTVGEVVAAARKANLSFVAITDHNVSMTDSEMAEDPPDLPVIAGEEMSTKSGHFVTLGVPINWQHPRTNQADLLLAAAHAAGGFNVIAHPFSRKIPWTDWNTSDFDGLEIWNEDEAWRRDNPLDLLISMLVYRVNDQLAMVRLAHTPVENLAKWEALLAQRPVVGMCGTDAHAAVKLGGGMLWRFPGYVSVFQVAREHALIETAAGVEDARTATAADIFSALKNGHSFCALDAMYPANGFLDRISTGGFTRGPGDFVQWNRTGTIDISVPHGASEPKIEVFRNGREIMEKNTWDVSEPLPGPGRYRTEVFLRQPGVFGWRRWSLWIFTNPIYVTAAAIPTGGAPRAQSFQNWTPQHWNGLFTQSATSAQ